MRSLALLLLPSLALAGTKISVRVDDGNKALAAKLVQQLRTKTGTKLDACWHNDAHVQARVQFEDGKVKDIQLPDNGDGDAAPCLHKVLHALTLDAKSAVAMFELDGTVKKKKATEPRVGLLSSFKNNHKVDPLIGTPADELGAGSLRGTGVSRGGGSRTGGAGTAEGDFVSKGNASQGDDVVRDPDANRAEPKLVLGATADRTPDEIQRVIKARSGVFRACYQRQLDRDPKLAGKLVVSFKIGADGAVLRSSIASSTLGAKDVESCVLSNFNRLKFPASGADASVTYPFTFSRG